MISTRYLECDSRGLRWRHYRGCFFQAFSHSTHLRAQLNHVVRRYGRPLSGFALIMVAATLSAAYDSSASSSCTATVMPLRSERP
mmetsp:Transcript_1276/g.787  ORF Transcript_1276/g.787 Transcript_1276/m.787 type:complete len:85 (-) Transcript_1276:13-267(-)